MRVLIADKLASTALISLQADGHEVFVDPSLKGPALVTALLEQRPDVLVVRSTKVTGQHLSVSSALSLVVRAGAGVNTIDLATAGAQGIYVSNCPGRNAAAVAELTMALMLGMDRHLADNVMASRTGQWNKARFGRAAGLKGRTLGLVGLGRIGREVACRAQAFGMHVVAWSRSLSESQAETLGVEYASSPQAVAESSDVLSVHLASCKATHGIIDGDLLGRLKDGAMFINTSRAEVLDESALLRELDAGRLRAGLDVFSGEPSVKEGMLDDRLAMHPQVYTTHHIGASTVEAQLSVAAEVARVVREYAVTGQPPNCVNLVKETTATCCLVVRHLDQVGALASVLDLLGQQGINVQEMSNTIFAGGGAAVARIQLHQDPSHALARLASLPSVLHVASVPISRRGVS
jgi:D-3-phosphoglycerate dehydrogenase